MINSIKPFILFVLTVFFLILASCSGFFDDGNNIDNSAGLSPLALADGSGYLSSEDHNEITPFLYRDLNSGRAWLFFSSDRDGDYDIFYAEMDTDGKFFNLSKMTNLINTGADEISPIIFSNYTDGSSGTALFISYIQISNNTTNIYTAPIDSNFQVASSPLIAFATNVSHLSLLNKTNFAASCVGSIGENGAFYCYWNYLITNWWVNTGNNIFQGDSSSPIYGLDGYSGSSSLYQAPDFQRVYLIESVRNSKRQLYYGALWSTMSYFDFTNFNYIAAYASSYDDGWPCIDLVTFKVYFSSKRHGKGFWNLYRFNYATFDLQFQWNLDGTNYAS